MSNISSNKSKSEETYLIVGAGISGLYSAYRLHKDFNINNIIIIEATNRIGGRIYTSEMSDTVIELGAGGIESVHKNMISLCHQLGLDNQIRPGVRGKKYAKLCSLETGSDIVPSINPISELIDLDTSDFYQIIDDITCRIADPETFNIAKSYSLLRFIERIYGSDKAYRMMYQHGYYSDFRDMNTIDALEMFNSSFSKQALFSRIDGGMIQIINRLAEYLTEHNIPIHLNTKLIDIAKLHNNFECTLNTKCGDVLTDKIIKLFVSNIILTMPRTKLLKIPYLQKVDDKLNWVITKELCRIYIRYPLIDGKVWFENQNSTITTNTIISQLVPYDKSKGILQIYCDDQNAKQWNWLYENGLLEEETYYQLRKMFPFIDIPKPLEFKFMFHPDATHVWRPGKNSGTYQKQIIQPIDNENIFIVGETYSKMQGWSEGAIQSVNTLMKHLFNKTFI
jgi:protoporphyrinogen oxidase